MTNFVLSVSGDPDHLYLDAANQTLYYGANAAGGTLQVDIKARDSVAGLQNVIFPTLGFSPGDGLTVNYPNAPTSSKTPQHSYTIDGSKGVAGAFAVTAADQVNNASGQSFSLVLDNLAPTVVLTVPTPAPMQIPLAWRSPDPDQRDFDLEYSPDGLAWSGWLTATKAILAWPPRNRKS